MPRLGKGNGKRKKGGENVKLSMHRSRPMEPTASLCLSRRRGIRRIRVFAQSQGAMLEMEVRCVLLFGYKGRYAKLGSK